MVPAILSMYPISFPIENLQGLDGCKRMGLDDNLVIAMVFNTTKQMYTDLKNLFLVLIKSEKNDEKLSKK
jgi:hypothetical protein